MKNIVKFKKRLTNIVTVIAWVFILLTVAWYSLVFFSVNFYAFSFPNQYVPESVELSKGLSLIVVGWSLFVFLICIIWVSYNKINVNRKSVNSNTNLTFIDKAIPWSVAMITKFESQNILGNVDLIKSNLSIIQPTPSNQTANTTNILSLEPQQQLNAALKYIKQGRLLKGVSLFRVIMENPESSPIVKKVARIKLSECIYELGYENFSKELVE